MNDPARATATENRCATEPALLSGRTGRRGREMSLTWSAFLPGVLCGVTALACAAGAIWGRRLPGLVRVLLTVVALPLAAVAFVLLHIGLGLSGH